MSFTLDVSRFVEKAKKNPEKVMRQVSIKLFSAIIKASPVDTGRFRMNWMASGGTPASGTSRGTDPSGANAISAMVSTVSGLPDWSEFTLTNNLPYAEVIEFGGYATGFHGPKRPSNLGSKFVGPLRPKAPSRTTTDGYSLQAPQGVVRVNVQRFNKLLEEEARKYK